MNKIIEIDLASVGVSLEALEAVPGNVARRLGVLPLVITDNILYVVADDPDDLGVIDQLEEITDYEVQVYAPSAGSDVLEAVSEYYPAPHIQTSSEGTGVGGVLVELLCRAVKMRASDIHVFPAESGAELLFRIDSTLSKARDLSSQEAAELISYVKVLAGMNIAEKKQPLDGSTEVQLPHGKVNLRVATMPTIYGERMALRILSDVVFSELSNLTSLGFDKSQLFDVSEFLTMPQGMIYLSGPTGSGKTTTLYSMLKQLHHDGGKHILSVEDPVENIIPGVTQVSVDSEGERVRFHKILRSVLRHDPDVILIGETRDEESANVAVNAAMTGHLVLSTVHANNSVAVIERLLELGVERSLLASSLSASIAQRLLRRPCKYCSSQRELTAKEKSEIGKDNIEHLIVTEATGCALCRARGSSGRIGTFEILKLNDKCAELIADKNATPQSIAQHIKPDRLLLDDALAKTAQGRALYSEVMAMVGLR